MRADVFRYVLMNDIGGLYCDLDYEFVRRFDFSQDQVVLSREFDRDHGDPFDHVANYFFASVTGHPLWAACLSHLRDSPPRTDTYLDVEVQGAGAFHDFASCSAFARGNCFPAIVQGSRSNLSGCHR